MDKTTKYKNDKVRYHQLVDDLRDQLQGRGVISRVEYVGSRYKGTATQNSDYDNLFVKRDTGIYGVESGRHKGFSFLRNEGSNNNIVSGEVLEEFKDDVQHVIDHNLHGGKWCSLSEDGPSVVLTYSHSDGMEFDVDLVFAYETEDDLLYIAKAPSEAEGRHEDLWKRTLVLREKDTMKGISEDHRGGIVAVRLMKDFKDIETNLSCLHSYIIEQALMHVHAQTQYDNDEFWQEDNIENIIKALLSFLGLMLRRGKLPAYHDHSNNVLDKISDTHREHLANRISKLSEQPCIILEKTGYKKM